MYVSIFDALLLKVGVSEERASGQKVFESLLIAAHGCLILVEVVETIVLACVNFRGGTVVVPEGSFHGSLL